MHLAPELDSLRGLFQGMGLEPTGGTVTEQDRLTVSVEEAVALLGISRALAYELVRRSELPQLRLGRRVVILRRRSWTSWRPLRCRIHVRRCPARDLRNSK